jgi:hypothetical protein
MKKIGVYKRKAGIIMIIVMSFHFFAGMRLFCADESLALLRANGSNVGDITALGSPIANKETSVNQTANGNGSGRTVPCGCKKKKKCPAIPRAIITSNPTHRPSEFQRLTKSECRDSLIALVTDRSFRARGDGPLLASAVSESFHSSTPLAFTCVLLI